MNQPGQGRKRKPTALVVLDGGRSRPKEPKPARSPIRMPSGMSARAKSQWRRLAPDLIAKGVLTTWDVDLFRMYCDQFWLYERAQLEVDELGPTVAGRNGEPVRNPAFSVMRDSLELIRKIGAQFGLSPSDRAGLSIVAPQKTGIDRFTDAAVGERGE